MCCKEKAFVLLCPLLISLPVHPDKNRSQQQTSIWNLYLDTLLSYSLQNISRLLKSRRSCLRSLRAEDDECLLYFKLTIDATFTSSPLSTRFRKIPATTSLFPLSFPTTNRASGRRALNIKRLVRVMVIAD